MKDSMRIVKTCAGCLVMFTLSTAAIPPGYKGTPFAYDTLKGKPQQIPGVIKAVFFDDGGEGVAFHDGSPGNTGGSMRKDAAGQQVAADLPVDMQAFTTHDFVAGDVGGVVDSGLGSWHLSWIDVAGAGTPGDWLNYTVHVNTAGTYDMDFHWAVAFENGLTTVTFSGLEPDSQLNAPISIRPPGDHEIWHDWKWDRGISSVDLDTGLYVMTLEFIRGSWNFDGIRFNLRSTPVVPRTSIERGRNDFSLVQLFDHGKLNISYRLTQVGRTSIRVVDCSGRTVLSKVDAAEAPGARSVAFGMGDVRQGMYIVSVEQNGSTESKSIVIVR
jgi:hypothetical protein